LSNFILLDIQEIPRFFYIFEVAADLYRKCMFSKISKMIKIVYQLVKIKSLFLILLAQRSWFFTGTGPV